MREYKDIKRQTLPCWSQLNWDAVKHSISILVHEDVVEPLRTLSPQDRRIEHLQKYGDFINEPDRWGIKGSLWFSEKSVDGFFEFKALIPQVKKQEARPCEDCNGKGIDDIQDFKCLSCYGTGRRIYFDWSPIKAISASLGIVSNFLNHVPPDEDTSSKRIQILTPVIATTDTFFSLYAEGSIELTRWLEQRAKTTIEEATAALRNAWHTMMNTSHDDLEYHRLEASVWDDGRATLCCPGDACEIFCDPMKYERGKGHTITEHNIDSPIQQLTLLAGLAAIEMQIRKELNI